MTPQWWHYQHDNPNKAININDTANKASPTKVLSKYTTQITTSYRNAYLWTRVYALCPPIKPSMICLHRHPYNINILRLHHCQVLSVFPNKIKLRLRLLTYVLRELQSCSCFILVVPLHLQLSTSPLWKCDTTWVRLNAAAPPVTPVCLLRLVPSLLVSPGAELI